MATEEEVVDILRYMTAAWPRFEISEQTVAVYVMHMLRTGLPADVLLLAAMRLVDRSEFFPSVAEWRAEAGEIEARRLGWMGTANYRLHGESFPPECCLPPGFGRQVLGYEPALPAGVIVHESE